MSFFGKSKSKPTTPFSERRIAWALSRGEAYVPRRPGYYAALVAREKAEAASPKRDQNQLPESGLRLLFLSL